MTFLLFLASVAVLEYLLRPQKSGETPPPVIDNRGLLALEEALDDHNERSRMSTADETALPPQKSVATR
jgi:hypothetical protein